MPTERPLPRGLYGIADAAFGPPMELAMLLADAGCRVIQLRAKAWTTGERADCARKLVEQLGEGVCLVMNDDLEAAAWAGVGGLHLGQTDGSLQVARQRLGKRALLGRSTHDLAQVDAVESAADYIGFGPVFTTSTKAGAGDARGVALLTEAVARARVPVVAIGGIGLASLPRVRQSGAHSWAVISDIFRHPDPLARARMLRL